MGEVITARCRTTEDCYGFSVIGKGSEVMGVCTANCCYQQKGGVTEVTIRKAVDSDSVTEVIWCQGLPETKIDVFAKARRNMADWMG